MLAAGRTRSAPCRCHWTREVRLGAARERLHLRHLRRVVVQVELLLVCPEPPTIMAWRPSPGSITDSGSPIGPDPHASPPSSTPGKPLDSPTLVLANRTIIGAFTAQPVTLRIPDPRPHRHLRLPKHVRYHCATPRPMSRSRNACASRATPRRPAYSALSARCLVARGPDLRRVCGDGGPTAGAGGVWNPRAVRPSADPRPAPTGDRRRTPQPAAMSCSRRTPRSTVANRWSR